ncbi:hypothetical protein [Metasolibacillus meyeri]|uniref:hypothetical protein n=1 Tax=Metasolibacillus meyeri TaxID=1071052 RepID=UPI000D314FAC|nr:hypothetical protein [Metasolibacillus meyeri]
MEITNDLGLKIVTENTFEEDDIKETIISYGSNFKIIETALEKKANSIDNIDTDTYKIGQVIWNSTPSINTYIGWVATRNGVHAAHWKTKREYMIGDLVRASPDNGYIYECVVDGKSSVTPPSFLSGLNQEFYDAQGADWRTTYNYQVGDVVFSTNGSRLFYYVCETAGISGVTEPSWSGVQNNTTLIDGSVVWRKAKTIRWKAVNYSCEFRPFGKID